MRTLHIDEAKAWEVLDALTLINQADDDRDFLSGAECYAVDKAITILREALADQPAQTATYTCGVCGVSMQMEQPAQPQQEPVATVIQFDGEKIIDASMAFFDKYPIGTDLYTSPPAQRTSFEAAAELRRLHAIEDAAKNLVKVRGHYHTEQAFNQLKELLK